MKRKYATLELAATPSSAGIKKKTRTVVATIPRAPSLSRTPTNRMIVQRFVRLGPLTASTSAAVGLGLSFGLSDLVNYTEFTALFDRYRFLRVDLTIMPRDVISTSNTGSGEACYLYDCIDNDDSTTPTMNSMLEESNMQVHSGFLPFRRTLVPTMNQQVTASGLSNISPPKTWVDCATPGIAHFGYKIVVPQATLYGSGSSVPSWYITAKYTIELAHAR